VASAMDACSWLGFTPDTSVIDISKEFPADHSHFRCDTSNVNGPSKSTIDQF